MNLFATVLTYPAPSANYRGESELNRTVIQKVTGPDNLDYPIFSPESLRNALREILRRYGLPANRERLHDEKQLAVKFTELPHPEKYADDFFFGYLVAASDDDRMKYKQRVILNEQDGRGAELRAEVLDLVTKLDTLKAKVKPAKKKSNDDEDEAEEGAKVTEDDEGGGEDGAEKKQIKKEIKKLQAKLNGILSKFAALVFKRDSVLRMNLAKALNPYRHNAIFTQSPLAADGSAYQNATTSALLHRETVVAGFQYPFALNIEDCKPKAAWTHKLLKAIGELNDVAGNHARSYFEMAPASIIARLTPSLVAGYQTYCFKSDGSPPDVVLDILAGDYPGNEFYLGGEIVKRRLTEKQATDLKAKGVTLDRDPRKLLTIIATTALGQE